MPLLNLSGSPSSIAYSRVLFLAFELLLESPPRYVRREIQQYRKATAPDLKHESGKWKSSQIVAADAIFAAVSSISSSLHARPASTRSVNRVEHIAADASKSLKIP